MSFWNNLGKNMGGATVRNMIFRMGGVCALMGIGAVALQMAGWEVGKTETFLRKELKYVPTVLGDGKWTAKISEDRHMTEAEEEVLETKKYLLRRYTDMEKQDKLAKMAAAGLAAQGSPAFESAKVGATLALNVNYYGIGGSDTHVPDVCWTGSGMERDFDVADDFELKDVKLLDGSVINVPLNLVAFKPTAQEMRAHPDWAGKENQHMLFVAYTFNVNSDFVAQRERLPQIFWEHRDKPFLYHTKIEVTVSERCTQAEARAVLEPFFRAILPEVLACIPDAKEELAKIEEAKKKAMTPTTSTTTPTTSKGP